MTQSTQSEFARQAAHMAAADAFHNEAGIERLVRAVGHSPSERLLDLACGPGIVAETLAPRVSEVIGIDITPEMVRLAGERFEQAGLKKGSFSIALAERLPFKDRCFDQVITRLSFHHFRDAAIVLSEIRRVLRDDGRLVLADVVSSEDAEESGLHNALEQLRDPSHVHMFSGSQLIQSVDRAGFELLSQESWQQEREFREWAAIVADPARTKPLEHVLRSLARAGQTAGIALREASGALVFTHTWILLVAKAG